MVAKYNTYKAFSTVLTFGTPIVSVIACGGFYRNDGGACISLAAVMAFLLSALFLKDKLAEQFKSPTALKVAVIGLIFCFVVEAIIQAMQVVFGCTVIACLIDEVSFKRLYHELEYKFPKEAEAFKHIGFYVTTTERLKKEENNTQEAVTNNE